MHPLTGVSDLQIDTDQYQHLMTLSGETVPPLYQYPPSRGWKCLDDVIRDIIFSGPNSVTSLTSHSDVYLPAIFFEMIGQISIFILVTSNGIFKVIQCTVTKFPESQQ